MLLHAPGDYALVRRGTLRSMLMRCPDGCGQTLAVNLDPRTGKAWRLDVRGGRATVFPSVWLEGGCKSHFIVWRDHIVWCDRYEVDNIEPDYEASLEGRVLGALTPTLLRSPEDIADELGEIPWDVIRAARVLVSKRLAVAGPKEKMDWFRRT